MINFKMNKYEINEYIKARFMFNANSKFITMAICMPFLIYFFVIGIVVDNEALLFAYSLLAIFCCLAFLNLLSYIAIKKNTMSSFYKIAKNNEIEYNISKNDDLYELKCLNNNEKFNFKISDLKKIKKYKNIIILQVNSKNIIALPKIKEIEKLIF